MSAEYAFFIVGLPGSGKELAANLLSHRLGVKHASSSSIVYDALARARGVQRWEIEAAPRDLMTPELERLGDALCAEDPGALVSPLLQRGVRVIDGVRRRCELEAARLEARLQGMVPVVVWLDRHSLDHDNTELSREDADFVISNHGSVGRLEALVANLADEFRVEATPWRGPSLDNHRLDGPISPPGGAQGDGDEFGVADDDSG